MARKCPECCEVGRAHLPGCSYAPNPGEREEFIRLNAVQLVRDLEDKVRRQAKELGKAHNAIGRLRQQRDRMRAVVADVAVSLAAGMDLREQEAKLTAALAECGFVG